MNTPSTSQSGTKLRRDYQFNDILVGSRLNLPVYPDVSSTPVQTRGAIIYDELTGQFYGSDGTAWSLVGGGGGVVTLTPIVGSTGTSVIGSGVSPSLTLKGILPGSGIGVASSGTDVVITNTSPASSVTLDDTHPLGVNEYSVISDGVGPAMVLKTIAQGSNVMISDAGGTLTISASGGGGGYVAGVGIDITGIVISNIGVTSLTGTANQISVSASTGAVTLSLPSSMTVNSLTLSSLTPNSFLYSGTGGLLTTTAAPTDGQLLIGSTGVAPVRSTLTAGSGITITNGAGSITITASGVAGVTTFSAGTTGFTPNVATSGAVTLAGVLNVANGGSGLSSIPTNGQIAIGNGVGYTLSTLTAGSGVTITNGAGTITIAATGVSGVSTFSAGTTGFTPNVATSGAITLAGTLVRANGGTGLSTAPTNGQLLIGNGATYVLSTLTAGSGISVTNGAGTITIASSGVTTFSAGTTGFTPSVATSGAVTLAGTLVRANGGTGLSTAPTNGQLLIGNGATYVLSTLTAGAGVTITNGAGTITIAATGVSGVTTFSAGTTGFTPNVATSGAITLAGTVNIGHGGTGITTTPLNGRLLIGNGAGYTLANLTAGAGVTITNGAGTITISSSGVAGVSSFSAGSTGFTPNVASTGAITLAGTLGRANGGTGLSAVPAQGQLLIGNGVNYSLALLTAGLGIGVANGAGSITVSNTGVRSLASVYPIALSASTGAITISTTMTGFLARYTANAPATTFNTITGAWSVVWGSGFTAASGIYTVPAAGRYLVNYQVTSSSTSFIVSLMVNGSIYASSTNNSDNGNNCPSASIIVDVPSTPSQFTLRSDQNCSILFQARNAASGPAATFFNVWRLT